MNKDCIIFTSLAPPDIAMSRSRSLDAQPEARGLSFLLSAGFLYHILSPTGLLTHFGRVWLSLPHIFSNSSELQLPDFLSSPSYIIVQSPIQSPTQSLEWHVWSSSSGNNCHAVQRSLSSGTSVYECIMGFYLVPFRQPNPPTRFLSITGHWDVSLPSGASLWNGMFGWVEGQNTTYGGRVKEIRCTNYPQGHSTYLRSCDVYKKEKGILEVKHKRNVSFMEARKIVGSYIEENSYAAVARRADTTNPYDKYRTLEEKLIKLEVNDWQKFQEHQKKLHTVEFYQARTQQRVGNKEKSIEVVQAKHT